MAVPWVRLALIVIVCSSFFGCQQPEGQRGAMAQRAATKLNWCYFEPEDLLVRGIDPRADYCAEKGGVWLTDGQGALLRDRMLGKERAARGGTGPSGKAPTVMASGSGIVVSRKGHILTNQHVVAECREVRVKLIGDMQIADVVITDEKNDLALLKLSSRPKSVATFRSARGVRLGDSIVVVGFPLRGLLASGPNVSEGIISALAGLGNDTRYIQISAPVQPGNSGGSLLDQSGNVVGIVVAKLDALKFALATGDIPQNVNFAINARIAQAFMNAHGIEYRTALSTTKLETPEIAKRGMAFTIPVECWE